MKFGRKPAIHTRRNFKSGLVIARHLDALGPPPPASNDWAAAVIAKSPYEGSWGMMGNDQVGDCTCADCGHQVMLHTANAGAIVTPTTADVEGIYKQISGWNGVVGDPSDTGCDENQVCAFMQSTGLLGQKADDYAAVDPQNGDHARWAVQLFGALRLGINVPQSFIDQFNAGTPIDDIGDTSNVGGHDVPIVKYDGQYFYIVTWGRLVPMTAKFLANAGYVEEAHAELYYDWIAAQGHAPSGFDLAALDSDLKSIA